MVTQNPGWSRIHGNTCLHDLQSRKRECLTQEIQCFCLEVVQITAAGSTRNLPSYSVLGKRRIEYLGRATVMAIVHLNKDNNVRNKKSSGCYGHLSARVTQTLHPASRSTSTATDPTQREWRHLSDQNPPTHRRSSPVLLLFFFIGSLLWRFSLLYYTWIFSSLWKRNETLEFMRFKIFLALLPFGRSCVSPSSVAGGTLVCGQQRRHSRRWFWGIWVTWYV